MYHSGLISNDAINADLGHHHIGDIGAIELALHPTLTSLDLRNNGIGNDGAGALALNTTITRLDLWHNCVSDIGTKALARNTTLTWLDLGSNELNTHGILALAFNTTLTSLNIAECGSDIKDEAFKALALNTTLLRLVMWGNDITDERIEALSLNTTLTHLNLLGCNIGNDGAKALSCNTTLTCLVTNSPSISQEWKNTIKHQIDLNTQHLHSRRCHFIRCLIVLACDDNEPKSNSSWNYLVPDMKRYILEHIRRRWSLGISYGEAYRCASYIFENITQLMESIREGKSLRIIQKNGSMSIELIE